MNTTVLKLGYRSGLVAFIATMAFFIAQLLQLAGTLTYPMDEILIYGFSLCITIPFLLEFLALYYATPAEKKIWSHAALLFSTIYVVFVTANYVVQLATVIPATLRDEAAEIKILVQTPHSLFWNFDAIGYIFMGLAALVAIPVFKNKGIQKWVKYIFIAHALTTPLIAWVYFYPEFSEDLLLIGLPWGITAPAAMLILALWFRKEISDRSNFPDKKTKTANQSAYLSSSLPSQAMDKQETLL